MRAKQLADLLKKGDRVAVSNITGREAAKVTAVSQAYCSNIVGGWALGKSGEKIECEGGAAIPVFGTFEELAERLQKGNRPNKIVVYSPPEAVYGEVKEVLTWGKDFVETIFVITEHVSVEVTAKIALLTREAGVDVLGCNTLGMINARDRVRVGAVGGEDPGEGFRAGSAAVISNSGNMVNTMASYLQSAGVGISFGVSTGKDLLILTPLKELLSLAVRDAATKLIVLYVEPGGLYEKEAVELMRAQSFSKPVVAYVAGSIIEGQDISLGHAGAVVEGKMTTATAKMEMFDSYFGSEPFNPQGKYGKTDGLKAALGRGIRVSALHHLPQAVSLVYDTLDFDRDFQPRKALKLNPWFADLGELGKKLPSELILPPGQIIEPYAEQFAKQSRAKLGKIVTRRSMRNASHASSNDGAEAAVYGIPVSRLMTQNTFPDAVILHWLGELPQHAFESKLVEMCLIAALTNGPGTISAQAAKLSASAGNTPNTAMIATLAGIGSVHGGNGKEAAQYLLGIFQDTGLADPYDRNHGIDINGLALAEAERFKARKLAAEDSGTDYRKIPCLGHPIFRNDPVNYDPRERIINAYLRENGLYNVFLELYHALALALKKCGAVSKVLAVNVDAAIACVWLGICWSGLKEKRITIDRATDCAFLSFALGRAAGGAGEYLDHRDHGTDMDMRVPVSECTALTKPR
jgi:succinyl-CoA synthetase alpha subunit